MLHNRFRAPFQMLLRATFFVAASAAVVVLSIIGYSKADHSTRMLLGVAGMYPALMFVVALLRFAAIATRSIRIYPDRLVHRQLFKNCEIPFQEIHRIEMMYSPQGDVETIRISWPGAALQVEAKAFEAFEDLFAMLRKHAGSAEVIRVEEFRCG